MRQKGWHSGEITRVATDASSVRQAKRAAFFLRCYLLLTMKFTVLG
jgi:hypothetical protein